MHAKRTTKNLFQGLAALLMSVLVASGVAPIAAQAVTAQVSTFAELKAAVQTNAADGDIIELSNDIIQTEPLTISKSVTLDGKGFTISVTNPGVESSGANSANPSTHGLFVITSANQAIFKDLTLIGGDVSTGAIKIDFNAHLKLQHVKLERCRNSTIGGAAVQNRGSLVIENSYLRRNSSRYGGAVMNYATLVMQSSSLTENRTEDANGGGGGVENQGSMWVGNSTFANNLTTAGGGAINNLGSGTLYVAHSTFVGNVSTGPYDGGAILSFNGATTKVASSLFAYNYSRNNATSTYGLDDFGNSAAQQSLAVASSVTVANSLVQSKDTWAAAINDTNVTDYTVDPDGTNDTLFSGGESRYPTGGTGAEFTTYGKVFRPNLLFQDGKPVDAIASSNTTAGLTGAPVDWNPTATFGYFNGTAWVSLVGTASSQTLTADQVGTTRSASAPRVGSLEGETARTYSVVSPTVSGGSVSGASMYGETYFAGSTATISALPANGKEFASWSINDGTATTTSTANPVSLTVNSNITATPTFATAAASSRSVTYSGIGATAGSAPSSQVSVSDIIISANTGSLTKAGYRLSGWNTSENGSGAPYAFGATYSGATNITLYPVWAVVVSYAVTYDSKGGSAVSAGSFESGGNISSAPTPPNKASFTFAGWSATDGGAVITFPYTPGVTSAITLFATWNAIREPEVVSAPVVITHRIELRGPNVIQTMPAISGKVQISKNTFTRKGYVFAGWNTQANGSGVAYADEAQIDLNADLVLHAQWRLAPTNLNISGFKGNSAQINYIQRRSITVFANKLPSRANLVCVGSTMGLIADAASRKLAQERATAVCKTIKTIRSDLKVSTQISPASGITPGARKVLLVFK